MSLLNIELRAPRDLVSQERSRWKFSSWLFVVEFPGSSATPPPLAVVGGALDRASKMNHNTPNPVLAASRVLELSLAKVAEK